MIRIGLIRERKKQPDERVAFTPVQCADIQHKYPEIRFTVEPSPTRCFPDDEYQEQGINVSDDLTDCHILMGVKEAPAEYLQPGKTYFFFSHTRKAQAKNREMMRTLIEKKVRMIDYECLTYEDEQRILGFGFFAGVVGAHNALYAYGRKWGAYQLPRAYTLLHYNDLVTAYNDVKLPALKVVVTGAGKVAAGVLDMLSRLDIEQVEPFDFLTHQYEYPVYTHLKGAQLYARRDNGSFHRDDFHANPGAYQCLFGNYVNQTDVLMNGIYWEQRIARLFEKEDVRRHDWRISAIADISCDQDGSVPVDVGSTTIADPVYGFDRTTLQPTYPYLPTNNTIEVMAVDNLPNELPRDAAAYFGQHLEKYILPELLKPQSDILDRATICSNGQLTPRFGYLAEYAGL